MKKLAPKQRRMAKNKPTKRKSPQPRRVLTVTVAGQVRPGRIAIPDLLILCDHLQQTVNRQAAALEGSSRTQKPGPATDKVRTECTLELAGIRHGSPTTAIGFELAKNQPTLPTIVGFGEDVIGQIIKAVESISEGRTAHIDSGVLHSLNDMGEVFDRGRIKSIRLTAPIGRGRKTQVAVFDPKARRRVAESIKPPTNAPLEIEGVVEMVDFKATDQRCRILPVFGQPVVCAFDDSQADDVERVARKPAKVTGQATINAQTGKLELLQIASIAPMKPLTLGAGNFSKGLSLAELAKLQSVEPITDLGTLAGGWPDDDDVDIAMDEIYRHRELGTSG